MPKTFIDFIEDQFQYGGVKYASTNSAKEATDELVEDFGWNWLIGTQAKYVKRYRNQVLEKDLLKIGCYQYINWLKRGYHLSPLGTAEMMCTTVTTKTEHFYKFVEKLRAITTMAYSQFSRELILQEIYRRLMDLRVNITEMHFLEICSLCSTLWELDGWNRQEDHKTDTWIEKKA
jgi:hypothetical protein